MQVQIKNESFIPTEAIRDGLEFSEVTISGDFTSENLPEWLEQIEQAGNAEQKFIPVIINSDGGDPAILFSVIAALKATEKTIVTINIANAHSCGSMLLASGTEGFRYCYPDATAILHEPFAMGIQGRQGDLEQSASQIKKLNKKFFQMYDSYAKRKEGYFAEMLKDHKTEDLEMTADELLQHGLIDHVGVPKWLVELSGYVKIK